MGAEERRIPNLEPARRDMEAGRLWKARDRLLGLYASFPDSQEVLMLLGQVFFQMGDWPEAGRYWYLTGKNDEEAGQAFAAFEEICGRKPCEMLRRLPFRAPYHRYGPAALQRIKGLLALCPQGERRIPSAADPEYSIPEVRESWKDRVVYWLVMALFVGPWFLGVVYTIMLIIWFVIGRFLILEWLDPRPG